LDQEFSGIGLGPIIARGAEDIHSGGEAGGKLEFVDLVGAGDGKGPLLDERAAAIEEGELIVAFGGELEMVGRAAGDGVGIDAEGAFGGRRRGEGWLGCGLGFEGGVGGRDGGVGGGRVSGDDFDAAGIESVVGDGVGRV